MKKRLDIASNVCACGVSVVCMSSMGAALVASVAAGGAGATGMAGMGSMGTSSAGQSAFLLLPRFFDLIGWGFLNQVSNAVAQPLLTALLTTTVVASYLAYRGHRRPYGLVLTLASSAAMYISIYVWMSEPLYFVSLTGLLAAAVWGITLSRGLRRIQVKEA